MEKTRLSIDSIDVICDVIARVKMVQVSLQGIGFEMEQHEEGEGIALCMLGTVLMECGEVLQDLLSEADDLAVLPWD